MAAIRILYPDVKSIDDFAFERAVVPDGVELIQYDASDPDAISDDVWRDESVPADRLFRISGRELVEVTRKS